MNHIKIYSIIGLMLLSGCTTVFETKGGIVVGTRPSYSTGMFSQRPLYATDYLSRDYYFYGPSVYILMPSMVYGTGWSGRGWYHARPNRKYDWFGQEEIWTN